MDSTEERFHLTLASADRPVMHGWWSRETIARGKFMGWIESYGRLRDARVTLTDEVTGVRLTAWPDEASTSAMLAP